MVLQVVPYFCGGDVTLVSALYTDSAMSTNAVGILVLVIYVCSVPSVVVPFARIMLGYIASYGSQID